MGEIRPEAKVLLIGEALGETEIEKKKPFVGQAGKRLDQALAQVGLPRHEISITNVYPRRPFDERDKNRHPTDEEIALNSPFCLDESTRVLMADLTWKRLGDIKIGDQLLSVSENGERIGPAFGKSIQGRKARTWQVAEVTAAQSRIAPCVEVETEHGRLIGTGDHRVLSFPRGRGRRRWLRLDQLQYNGRAKNRASCLTFTIDPWAVLDRYNTGWLAGFFNGEGFVAKRSWSLGFAQNSGPLLSEALNRLRIEGFQAMCTQASSSSNRCEHYNIKGGIREQIRFLGMIRPGRLLPKYLTLLKQKSPRLSATRSRVLSRKSVGQRRVIDIRTTSGTFIAEGFVVHNCERLVALHPNRRAVGLLGGVALKWRTGEEGIKDYRGEEFQRNGLWYVPTIHPSATLYAGSDYKWLVQDLKWLKTLAEGDILDASRLTFPFIHAYGDLIALLPFIGASKFAYIDIETAAVPPASPYWWWDPRVRPVLVSLSFLMEGKPVAFVVEWNDDTAAGIKKILAEARPDYWCGSSALYFDFPLLRRLGFAIEAKRELLDTYPIGLLNDENRGCGLKDLAKQHLHAVNHEPYWGATQEDAFHSRWGEWDKMSSEEQAERTRYSGLDAYLGIQCLSAEIQRISTKPHLIKLYKDLIRWQAEAIAEMNALGMPLDVKRAGRRVKALERLIARRSFKLRQGIPEDALIEDCKNCQGGTRQYKRAGYVCRTCGGTGKVRWAVNFNSGDQMDRLIRLAGLPQIKTTPSGDRGSADKFVLLTLQDWAMNQNIKPWIFPILRGALRIHEDTKSKGYAAALLEASKVSHDGRVHSTFKIGPVTWRLASENPNLQQLPSRVKKLFRTPPGQSFVKHDESALEVRGLADQSGDPTLIQRIRDDIDMHWAHATGFMNKPYDAPKEKKKRQAFKTLFFAGGYGARPPRIALTLRDEFWTAGIGVDTVLDILGEHGTQVALGLDPYLLLAEEWLAFIGQEYPGLNRAFLEMSAKLQVTGLVRSYFQAERRLPEVWSKDKYIRGEAERMAWNFRPQNLSLVTAVAYRTLYTERKNMGWEENVRLGINEHDSLMWLADDEIADVWEGIAKAAMEDIDFSEWGSTFAVPLKAEGVLSKVWS